MVVISHPFTGSISLLISSLGGRDFLIIRAWKGAPSKLVSCPRLRLKEDKTILILLIRAGNFPPVMEKDLLDMVEEALK